MNGPQPDSPGGLRLLDLAAFVVGYSLAALLIRAFWSTIATLSPVVVLFLAIALLWLGLAMSGPFILLLARHRGLRIRGIARDEDELDRGAPPPARRYTGPESAWILIGGYWIAMAVLVVPNRWASTSLPVLAALPFIVALLLIALTPYRRGDQRARQTWTHRTAIFLLLTWPVTWIALIALTRIAF